MPMGLTSQSNNAFSPRDFSAQRKPSDSALLIDLQSVGSLSTEDARDYLDHMAATLTDLRERKIPVIWVTITGQNKMHPPLGMSPRTRADMSDFDFYGLNADDPHHEMFKEFLEKHGPKENEAVYCKSIKGAFTEARDAADNIAYQWQLESECGKNFDEIEEADLSLASYMRQSGLGRPLVMGAISSHCVSETAAIGVAKGFDCAIDINSVISWNSPEDLVNTKITQQVWRAGVAQASEYHAEKIRNKLTEICATPEARNLSQADIAKIQDIPLVKTGAETSPSSSSDYTTQPIVK